MACTTAPAAFLPPGKHRWSEDICQGGVFGLAVNADGDDVPVSINRIRAMGFRNGDPCKHHVGRTSLDAHGDDLPWYCGTPIASRSYVSPMGAAVNDDGDDVLFGHHKGPPWTELVFYSLDRYCMPPMG